LDTKKWKLKKLTEILEIWNPELSVPFDQIFFLGDHLIDRFNAGSKLYFLGNGGSAAESMHLAAEFTGHCIKEHRPLPALSLSDSQSAITAIANDYGFEKVFQRQVEAYVNPGDTLICLSTSGKSKNVVLAAQTAVERGAKVVLWTGGSGVRAQEGIEVWNASSFIVPRIQEIHLLWGHLLAEYIEDALEETFNS
jgi:D-sedoheptulose 7-phosphate isomerase